MDISQSKIRIYKFTEIIIIYEYIIKYRYSYRHIPIHIQTLHVSACCFVCNVHGKVGAVKDFNLWVKRPN